MNQSNLSQLASELVGNDFSLSSSISDGHKISVRMPDGRVRYSRNKDSSKIVAFLRRVAHEQRQTEMQLD